MEARRRKFKNYLINSEFQFKISFYFVVSIIAIFGVMLAFIYNFLNEIRFVLLNSTAYEVTTQMKIAEIISNITNFSWLIFGFSIVVSTGFAILVSHRIAGPMFAICAVIEDLKKGNYKNKRTLRPYDELRPIMDGLHELADSLEAKNKGS